MDLRGESTNLLGASHSHKGGSESELGVHDGEDEMK